MPESIDTLALAPRQTSWISLTFRTLPPSREAEVAFTGKVLQFADKTGCQHGSAIDLEKLARFLYTCGAGVHHEAEVAADSG